MGLFSKNPEDKARNVPQPARNAKPEAIKQAPKPVTDYDDGQFPEGHNRDPKRTN